MTPRERVRAAISHQRVDRVPWGELLVEDDLVRSMLGVPSVGFEERHALFSNLGLDLVCIPTRLAEAPCGGGLPPAEAASWPDLRRWSLESGLFVFVLVDGAFGWGTRLLGWERFICAVVRDPAGVREMARQVERLNLRLAQTAVELGAHGVLVADDIAHGRGLMISPGSLREAFLPSLARLAGEIRSLGAAAFFHSDGNLAQAIPDLLEAGFQGIQGIEAGSGMDLRAIRGCYGDRLCLWGNLDLAELVLPRSREELEAAVRGVLSAGWQEGGLIFGTSSGLTGDVLRENLETVPSVLRESPAGRSPFPEDASGR